MGNVFLLTSRASKGLLNERCYRLVRIHHHGVHADARQVPNPLLDNHVPDVHVATISRYGRCAVWSKSRCRCGERQGPIRSGKIGDSQGLGSRLVFEMAVMKSLKRLPRRSNEPKFSSTRQVHALSRWTIRAQGSTSSMRIT